MKKWISMLLMLLMFCMPALAEENWEMTVAGEMMDRLNELVRDEVYQTSMTLTSLDCVTTINQADFTAVKRAYRATFSTRRIRDLVERQMRNQDGLTEAAWEKVTTSLPQVMLTMYNGRQSAEAVAASSVLTVSRTYRMPEGFKNGLLILELDGAVAGVAFMQTGEDTVTVAAQPLFCEEGETIEDVLRQMNGEERILDFQKIQ